MSRAGARGRPRARVWGILLICFAGTLVIPATGLAPPGTLPALILGATLAAFVVALGLVLWVAVNPGGGPMTSWWATALLLAAAGAAWVPAHAWAEQAEHPWAWLSGLAIAACALLSWQAGVVALVLLTAGAAAGGVASGSAMWVSIAIALGCAGAVWGMCHAFVWLLRLVREAQAARDAHAALAVAEERLRAGRELHDVLGHRLGVLALQAELAADLAPRDPDRAIAQLDGVRRLARETMAEARQAIHGETVADLPTQLGTAALVLRSAGAEVDIDADPDLLARLPPTVSRLHSTVVREAVTNVLRHSDARTVTITVAEADLGPVLTIVNDGLRGAGRAPGDPGEDTSGGTGLVGLSARCAGVGAHLVARSDARRGRFELRVDGPHDRRRSV